MQHEELKELVEPYVLGCLDASEQAEVEAHLAQCLECQRLATEYQEAAALLPHALATASPLRPDPSVKERLLEAAKRGAVVPSPAPSELPGGRPWWPWRLPRWPWLARPGLVTVSIVLILLALFLSLSWGLWLDTALARERNLSAELASLVGRQEVVLEVVDSNRTVKRILRATDSASPSYGKLYTRPDLPHVVAMVARLPQSPQAEGYHLWVRQNGEPYLAGVLTINNEGFGILVFDANLNGPVYQAAWLTLQPLGTTAPSDVTVLRWDASK